MIQSWFQAGLTPFASNLPVKYVAALNGGTLLTSGDGTTWTTQAIGFGTSNVTSVVRGSSKWVAVGAAGHITWSTDGVIWNHVAVAESPSFTAVEYNETAALFMATTTTTALWTSADAITWTSRTGPGVGSYVASSASYKGQSYFVSTNNHRYMMGVDDALNHSTVDPSFAASYYVLWCVGQGAGLWLLGGQAFKISTAPANATTGVQGGFTLRKGQDTNPNSCVRAIVYDQYRNKYVALGSNSPSGNAGPALISSTASVTSWPTASSLSMQLGASNYVLSAAVSSEAGYVGTATGIYKTTDWVTYTSVATGAPVNRIAIRTDI